MVIDRKIEFIIIKILPLFYIKNIIQLIRMKNQMFENSVIKRALIALKSHQANIVKGLLFLLSIVLLVVIFPKEGKFKYEFQKGRPWMHRDLIATYDFAILKPASEIDDEQNSLLKNIKPYFIYDENLTTEKQDDIYELFEIKWDEKYMDSPITEQKKNRNWFKCSIIYDTIMSVGIVESLSEIEDLDTGSGLILIRGNTAEDINIDDVFSIQSAYDYMRKTVLQDSTLDLDLLMNTIESSLFRNIKFDKSKTEEEQQLALSNLSQTRGMVQTGERIISKGELVSGEKFQILESMKKEYEEQLGSSATYYMIVLGQVILITISMVVLLFFLLYFRSEIFDDNIQIALILLVVIMMVFITSLVIKYNVGYLYLVPICIIPLIIRSFFDTRPALYVHIITIIIIGFLVPNSFEFVFLQLIAGIVAIISIVKLQRRAQFFMSSFMIFLTYSAVYFGLSLIQEGSLMGMDWKFFMLFAGSAILTLFSYPLIYLFEKVFGLITDVTLIELSNTNNSLLRELSSKAPGTFQHSMQVANLAEEILYEIGGNTLLARTGALYHDIGKMDTPVYFVENQQVGVNPHDKLDPDDSAKIIVKHIRRGVQMAKKYNLPKQVIDFIITHQGNRRVEYFYHMKKNMVKEEEINQKIYSYPGPIPMSRETAVVMMADSVEAASRSIKEPTEESLSKLVDNIIDKQIEADQFIDSNITFREITKIKEILKKKLLNIYHVRIEYPE